MRAATRALPPARAVSPPPLSEVCLLTAGLLAYRRPWDVPAHWYEKYPAAEDIKLADHRTAPQDYGPARNYSWDPQSGPRHCGPLKELSNQTDPQMGEFELVPDMVAKNFRRGYFAAVSSMDYNAGLVLDELEALKLQDQTIVIFLGDQ